MLKIGEVRRKKRFFLIFFPENAIKLVLPMKKMLLVSLFIHLICFFGMEWSCANPEVIRVELQEGGVMSLSFSSAQKGSGQKSIPTENRAQSQGTLSEAIAQFQNSISYPPLALEQGWESECTWEVEMGENGSVVGFKPIQNCKYQIFQSTVESHLKSWKFPLGAGQSFTLPVRFRIQNPN